MVNGSVASVEESGGLVCGLKVGLTRLVATVHSERGGQAGVELAQDEISVQVALMTGLALELPSAHLVAGSQVEVQAQPLYHSEPIFGARDLVFSWDSSNEDALAVSDLHNINRATGQVSREPWMWMQLLVRDFFLGLPACISSYAQPAMSVWNLPPFLLLISVLDQILIAMPAHYAR